MKKGVSTFGWIVIVLIIVIAIIVVVNMILGAQTHPFWEVR